MRWVSLLVIAVLAAGCARDPGAGPTPTLGPPTGATPATPLVTPPPLAPPHFDGERALAHVEAQVRGADGGPRYRVPGTPGNAEVARYIDDTLAELGYNVTWHHFNASYGCDDAVPMHNVIAERAGTSGKLVAFAAHYDTRPVADKDPDSRRRDEPILGANDGGSGVGVLLELARVLPPSADAVRLLFFDGEDGGGRWAGFTCPTDWILGSRAYAESLSEEELGRFRALVLVDMVGDPKLVLPKEGYTAEDARGAPVQDAIYATGKALGHAVFLDRVGAEILDDHVPFLERKVAAVDLIHTVPGDPRVFPSWHHTHEDDLDVVSAESLDAVGETLEAWFTTLARAYPPHTGRRSAFCSRSAEAMERTAERAPGSSGSTPTRTSPSRRTAAFAKVQSARMSAAAERAVSSSA